MLMVKSICLRPPTTTVKYRVNWKFVTKQYCDFVCWTNKGVHVDRILRDRSSFEHIKPSLDHFFQEALLPCILCGSDFTFKENIAPPEDEGEVLYCWCQEPEYGKMICCDNDFCEYEWFHYSCVGITRKPRGKWYYSEECRTAG